MSHKTRAPPPPQRDRRRGAAGPNLERASLRKLRGQPTGVAEMPPRATAREVYKEFPFALDAPAAAGPDSRAPALRGTTLRWRSWTLGTPINTSHASSRHPVRSLTRSGSGGSATSSASGSTHRSHHVSDIFPCNAHDSIRGAARRQERRSVHRRAPLVESLQKFLMKSVLKHCTPSGSPSTRSFPLDENTVRTVREGIAPGRRLQPFTYNGQRQ